jgi:hypothetical protein
MTPPGPWRPDSRSAFLPSRIPFLHPTPTVIGVVLFRLNLACPSRSELHEAARFRQAGWRYRGGVANSGARAAAGDASDRVHLQRFTRNMGTVSGRIPRGSGRGRLRRTTKYCGRISLGGGPIRSPAGASGRPSSPSGGRYRGSRHACDPRHCSVAPTS